MNDFEREDDYVGRYDFEPRGGDAREYALPEGKKYCGGCGHPNKLVDLVPVELCPFCRMKLKEKKQWE